MPRLTNTVIDDIAGNCLALYEKLPRNGKPVGEEWTVLSCVVQTVPGGTWQPVALGTGSKCVGAGLLVPNGTRLHDSHAEVCARRGFLIYLYDQVALSIKNKPSIFSRDNNRFYLKDGIEFIFYSSQLPCGDASILPKAGEEEDYGELLQSNKRPVAENVASIESKRRKVGDIHRTGAKCLPGAEDDPRGEGPAYHRLGSVRTKPGRGERTLSVSCSDKIARWVQIGIQGGLLHMLCGSLFIKHFVFGGGVPYSEESLKRALLTRGNENSIRFQFMPEFYQSSLIFRHVRTNSNMRPAPGSIIWVKNFGNPEVAVQGRKLGLTKKKGASPQHALCITKYKLYERFLEILLNDKLLADRILGDSADKLYMMPYNEMKRKSTEYVKSWTGVKQKFFGSWTVKPDMWNFCIEEPTDARAKSLEAAGQ